MANPKRFHHHHKKAAAAMKSGDVKMARSHVGHMLKALADNAPQGAPQEPDADDQAGGAPAPALADANQQQPNPMAALRQRLGAFQQ